MTETRIERITLPCRFDDGNGNSEWAEEPGLRFILPDGRKVEFATAHITRDDMVAHVGEEATQAYEDWHAIEHARYGQQIYSAIAKAVGQDEAA